MRIALLIVLAALGLGGIAWLVKSGPVEDPVPQEETPDVQEPKGTSEVKVDLETAVQPDRVEVTAADPAFLKVTVVDVTGRPLQDARVYLTFEETVLEKTGRCEFGPLQTDEAKLRVEHDEFPTWERVLTLSGGSNRQVVQLRVDFELRGQVVDRFGRKIPAMSVFILEPDKYHPERSDQIADLITASTDSNGKMKATLPHAGKWRISVGRVSNSLITTDPIELTHGGPDHFRVVIPGATRIQVQVENPDGGNERLAAVLMQRPANPDERTPEQEAAEAARNEAKANLRKPTGKEDRVDPNGLTSGAPVPERYRPDWVNRTSRRVGTDGSVIFTDIPDGLELRMALIREGERYESPTIFVPRTDELLSIEATMPSPGTTTGGHTHQCAIDWRSDRLAPDENPVGVTMFWVR